MSHAIRYPMTGAYRAAAELYAGLLAAAASAPDDDSAFPAPLHPDAPTLCSDIGEAGSD